MAAEQNADRSGLMWEAFPDLRNPVHVKFWKALWEKRRMGDGFGSICNYYEFYLVTVSDFLGMYRKSSFIDPTRHLVIGGDEHRALDFYGGERNEASIRHVMEQLLAVNAYKAFIVEDCNQIPHKAFQKDNPNLAFEEFLRAKGITVRPPSLLQKNERAEISGYSECNVFAYSPYGGEVYRYELQFTNGLVTRVERFLIATDIGDCWYPK
jgi:hypothetical protein